MIAARDVLVAGVTAAVSLGLLLAAPLLAPADTDASWLLAALLVAQAAALLPARTAPRLTLVLTAVLGGVSSVLVPAGLHGVNGPAVLVAVAVVVATSRRRIWPYIAGAGICVALGDTIAGWSTGSPGTAVLQGVAQAVSVVAFPAAGALVVRSRRESAQARDREREARLEAAVARERTAMARELHDIAAHHLSGIALMAAVVDRQIDTDPVGAHSGARQIRAQSTEVLDDLRRLVGLLREDSPATREVPTLEAVADLVDPGQVRIRRREGVPLGAGTGPLAQLVAYRAVQEALSNARIHAPGASCVVDLDDRVDGLVVRVQNSAPARVPAATGAGGFGLRGMRERADLVGGTLRYGPTGDGGWQVELLLPRETEAE